MYAVVNPADGKLVKEYPTASDADIASALQAAQDVRAEWEALSVSDRASRVARVAALHRERREELARIITREMGKSHVGALGEVDFSADIYDYYAENAERFLADQPLREGGDETAVIRRSPFGPLLGIMPWNYPYYQIARFAAPNLVTGNEILLKPAPECPESSAAVEAIMRDAGVPLGAYQTVLATNEQSATIIADPRLRGVSLTGSERAGRQVAAEAGAAMKKCVLELGGSDPFIVLSVADMDETVDLAILGRLDNNGQVCNGAKRFIVIDSLYDEFVSKFTQKMASAQVQNPSEVEETELGPLVSEAAAQRLSAQVQHALDQGATAVVGGAGYDGAYVQATVLTGITPEADAFREEFFGPVAQVYRVSSEDEAISLANATGYGLGSYVFTTDRDQAERVADRLETGMVYVNAVGADAVDLPFGGVKNSGFGRELGPLGIDEFVNKKLVYIAGV